MKLEWSPELGDFRARVRRFIAEHSPGARPRAGVRAPEPELVPRIRAWVGSLYEAGYLGADWPARYGGRADWDEERSFVVAEELARARAWEQVGAAALAAHALIGFGTDAQRDRYLPRIRSGEDLWCQLFSEPGAGSDLAALATRARRDGDHWVVDGQKVWTTNGQHADVGYLLARTNDEVAKTRGITAFALDMRTPGIDVRPLREITGTADFNEVFLDGVRVPADCVIGEVDGGWTVANASLAQERVGTAARAVDLRLQLDRLVAFAARERRPGSRPADDGGVRERLGRVAVDVFVVELMAQLVRSRLLHGTDDVADAPLMKIFFSESGLALAELGMALQGVEGALVEGDPDVVDDGWWQDAYLIARSFTIAGGANELLRTIVPERLYGLPREPRWP